MNELGSKFCTHCGKEVLQAQQAAVPHAIQERSEATAAVLDQQYEAAAAVLDQQYLVKQEKERLHKEAGALEQQYWQTNDSTLLPRIKELRQQSARVGKI